MVNSLLIAYTVYAKISLVIAGVYILRLRKQIKELESGPQGFMCETDFNYELEPEIKSSSVTVCNHLLACEERLGKKHSEECGIVKVRIVKIETVKKGRFYGEE